MKDIAILLTSLTLISGISWFFFSKDKKKDEENQESGDLEKLEVNISGMHCAGCAAGIEATLKMVSGIKYAAVNFATSKGEFLYDPSKITKQQIIEKIKELGYDASIDLESFEKKS
ncbi:cation transporter [Sulfurihydrogenibium azorense]|uniref:cation transporter n=1 Tax=Sulfurihydrogenibium azorense TaxID=309806 RepID=UPI0024096106|nr:heavy metal-associated domain-containing protein [Sulfurihydrogenibium azorense]MDM7272905.1 heavy metal-associated domain-containing protein [Sulfurihydrogenibium azorense]